MAVMMPLIVPSMYPDWSLNLAIYAGCAWLFLLAFAGIRSQVTVGNSQFPRSMIPYHSGAILMCEQAAFTDPEIKSRCRIIRSQAEEIDQMKAIRRRLWSRRGDN